MAAGEHRIFIRFPSDRQAIISALEIAAVRMEQSAEWPGQMTPQDRQKDQQDADTFRRIASELKHSGPVPVVSYGELADHLG